MDTDPEVENTNSEAGDPKLRKLWGDPEVREPELDPDQGNLVWQRDSDGQIDSDEHEVLDETPLPHKVHDQTSENIHEVQTLNSSNDSGRYMLPFRYN